MESQTGAVLMRQRLSMEVISIVDKALEANLSTTIFFVLSGNFEVLHNGRVIYLKEGDIYLINRYDLFGFVGDGSNHVLVTQVNSTARYQLRNPLSPSYMKEAYDKISHALATIFIETQTKQQGFEDIIEGYVYRLRGLFQRYLPHSNRNRTDNKLKELSQKSREIIDYINLNYAEDISLDSLSETFFLSKYYLAHSFKEQVGLTVGNYIKEIRLIHSHALVEKTTRSMIDIANETGFPNVRSFSEGFKQKYGLTPLAYRQERQLIEVDLKEDVLIKELAAIQILNDYAGIDGVSQLNKKHTKEIEVNIYPNTDNKPMPQSNLFVRVNEENFVEQLDKIQKMSLTRYVSVTNLLGLIKLKVNRGKFSYDETCLFNHLHALLDRGLLPYFQISFLDYDYLEELGGSGDTFSDIYRCLVNDLHREFRFMLEWRVEFRCFYEFENSGKLCHPVKNVISHFRGIGCTLIHLPVQPDLEVEQVGEDVAYIIDDLARVKGYSYEAIIELLTETKYLDIISENKNIELQSDLVKRMSRLEEDTYYQGFMDLVYANQMLWPFMHRLNQSYTSFEPLSLKGKPLFTYFPKSMASSLSLLNENNIRRDMWYAYQFRSKLFSGIIFNNEFCVITKQGDNYRLLAIYPENEVLENLFGNTVSDEQEATMSLKIKLQELKGTYQIVEQKITPDQKMSQKDYYNIANSEKLSSDLIRYIDEVTQPTLKMKVEKISNGIDIVLKLPIFGISYCEISKID